MKPVSRLLMLVALASAPLASLAGSYPTQTDPFGGYWQGATPKVAELTREERAKFRQQWQEMAPEERHRYREEFMKRDRGEDADKRNRSRREEEGYGQGYESRHWERPEYAPRPFERPEATARPFERPDSGSESRGRR